MQPKLPGLGSGEKSINQLNHEKTKIKPSRREKRAEQG
jgi:hypothetical protein